MKARKIVTGGRYGGKTFAAQLAWLATYDRTTGSLSTVRAKHCGYGDMMKAGLVVNRGPDEMPDLFITAKGMAAVVHLEQDAPK